MPEDFLKIVVEQMDRLLGQHLSKDILTAADRGEWVQSIWDAASEAGLPLAMVPESQGGVGLGPADVMNLIRRLGYFAVPLPLAETMVANHLFVDAAGETLEGSAAFAPVTPDDKVAVTFDHHGATLHGAVRYVPWGTEVRNLVIFARDENGEGHLCRLPRDVVATGQRRRNVAYEPRENVNLDGVRLAADAVVAAPGSLHAAGLLPYIAAIRIQQMVGGMERALDYALAYANERVQFGRPIGKFQAIQHMLAVAAGHFAAASAAADAVSDSFGGDLLAIAIAKSRCGEAAGHVAAACHQVHGAMGFTHEHALHFTTRRLWSWRDEGGSEAYWEEWIGRTICAQGGEALWPTITAGKALETAG